MVVNFFQKMYPPFTDAGIQFFKELEGKNYIFLFEYNGSIHGKTTINHARSLAFLNTLYGVTTSAAVTTNAGETTIAAGVTTNAGIMPTTARPASPRPHLRPMMASNGSPHTQHISPRAPRLATGLLASLSHSPALGNRFPAPCALALTTGSLASVTRAPGPFTRSPVSSPRVLSQARGVRAPAPVTHVSSPVTSSGHRRPTSSGHSAIINTPVRQPEHSTPARNSILRADKSVEDIFAESILEQPQCSPVPHLSHAPLVTRVKHRQCFLQT